MSSALSYPLSVAPMMDWTDRHCRFFHRLIAPRAVLYTEMVHAQAVIHNAGRVLPFDEEEKPLVLQLGGSDPEALARAAIIGESYGYDAINLNCGCPSERVQEGRFDACLMADPNLIAACVTVMGEAVAIPVTVKCRIGLDGNHDPDFLERFVSAVKAAGCKTFILHARTAILKGFSPKENRDIPPLRPDMAAAIKAATTQAPAIRAATPTSAPATRVATTTAARPTVATAAAAKPTAARVKAAA